MLTYSAIGQPVPRADIAAKAIPDGYHSITPYLIVKGGAKALEFYNQAFGAEELYRMPQPDGRIGHAEVKIGDYGMPVYEARPAAGGPVPIVVCVSEIWGVHEGVRDCTRRFAKEGYLLIVRLDQGHRDVGRPDLDGEAGEASAGR